MKDLTCPLHGTSLIKQALRRHWPPPPPPPKPPRRTKGSIKTSARTAGWARGLKPRCFPPPCASEREKAKRKSKKETDDERENRTCVYL